MKIAIIVGGSKGIGAAISKKFMLEGFTVIIGSRTKPKFKLLNKSIWIKMDSTNISGHEKLFRIANNLDGVVETYINNVGFSEWRSLKNINKKFIDKMLLLNLYSTIYGCKVAAKHLSAGTCIINISSIAGKRGSINNSIYCSAKFAVNGFTQAISKELGKRDIRVNAVCPVLIQTPGLINALSKMDSPKTKSLNNFLLDFVNSQVSLNYLPSADDVANICLFLSSKHARSITGQCINLDSGIVSN